MQANDTTIDALNHCLTLIRRSLVQYAVDTYSAYALNPKTADAVHKINEKEVRVYHALYQHLESLGVTPHVGAYPGDPTRFNYVTLDYVLREALKEEKRILAEFEKAAEVCRHVPRSYVLLNECIQHLHEIIQLMEHALAPAPSASAPKAN